MRVEKATLQMIGLILVVISMFLASPCWAEKKVDPKAFNNHGTIDLMEKNRIVMGDTNYKFEAETQFYSADGREIGSGYFAKGMNVGYDLKKGAVNVISRIGKID